MFLFFKPVTKPKIIRKKRKTSTTWKKNIPQAYTLATMLIKDIQFLHPGIFEYNKVSIRNQKTRWGSCSSNKNLNFNYKIIYLPEELARYLIVHELCHLKHLNHSADFWNLVKKLYPDYKKAQKSLRSFKIPTSIV